MADRRVKVIFEAQVANFRKGMQEIQEATEKAKKATEGVTDSNKKQLEAMSQLGPGLAAIGTGAVAGLGLAVKAAADFDKAMSSVQAATHESTENMELLRQAAVDAGAKLRFHVGSPCSAHGCLSQVAYRRRPVATTTDIATTVLSRTSFVAPTRFRSIRFRQIRKLAARFGNAPGYTAFACGLHHRSSIDVL